MMEVWRSIENDPPEMEQTVYATDGKGMWVGQIIRGYEEPLLDGLCLENGHAVCIPLCVFTEWKPAQAAFRERKSADKMFWGLGYSKTETEMPVNLNAICYANETRTRTIIYGNGGAWKMELVGGEVRTACLLDKGILALARLIEEMEAENGKAD